MRKRRPKGILDRMRLWKAVFLLGVSFLFYLLVLSPHGGAVKEYSGRAIAVLKEKVGQRVSPPARNAPLRAQSNTTTLGLPTDLYPNSPHIGKLLKNIGYISCFSEKYGIPIWVAYITKYPFAYDTAKRPSEFITDYRVNSPEHSDYTRSGYDRGHMAPNYAIGRTYGPEAQRETFYMTNIIPQRPNVNRDQWRDLEQFIANDLAARYGTVLVFTGPLISEDMPKLKNRVSVPSAMWMVITVRRGSGEYITAGFIIPQQAKNKDFRTYLVPVDKVEELTGLNFFPKLPDNQQHILEAPRNVRLLN